MDMSTPMDPEARPKSKGPLFAIAGVLLLVVCGLVWTAMSLLRGGDVGQVADRLPDDTIYLASVRGFASLILEFEDEFNEMTEMDMFANNERELEDLLGFDLADMDSIQETGFSFTDPWAFAVIGEPDDLDMDLVVLIPVSDTDAVLDYIDDRADELGLDIDEEDVEDFEALVFTEDDRDEGFAGLIDGDYFIGCLRIQNSRPSTGDDALDCLEDLVTNDASLAGTDSFQDAMALVDDDWNILSYLSTEWMEDALHEFGDIGGDAYLDIVEDVLERWPALVATVSMARDELHIETISLYESEHEFALDGEDELASRIPGDALALMRISGNWLSYWSVMKDDLDDMDFLYSDDLDDMVEMAENQMGGIDIEDDLLANFTGHISMVLLEAESGDEDIELVVYASIEDEELAIDVAEEIAEGLGGREIDEEELDDGTYFVGDVACLGVLRDHMVGVVSDNADRACARVFEAIEEGGESFLEDLPGYVEDGLEDGPSTYVYASVTDLIDALGDNSPQTIILEELVEGIECGQEVERNHVGLECRIIPPEGDFGPGILSYFGTWNYVFENDGYYNPWWNL